MTSLLHPSPVRPSGGARRLAAVCALLTLTACGPRVVLRAPQDGEWPPPAPADASREDLVARLAAFAEAAKSLSAETALAYKGPDGKLKTLSVRMALARPDRLYLKGYRKLLPTFFTLVGNDRGLWVDVPSRNKVYHAPPGARLEPQREGRGLMALGPETLVSAIVPDPPQPNERFLLTRSSRGHELIAVDGASGRILRQMLFHPSQLVLIAMAVYDETGREVLRTRYESHRETEGLLFPYTVMVERPVDGVSLEFAFEKVRFREVSERLFEFEPASQRELVDLVKESEAAPAFWPEDEVSGSERH